MTKKKTEQSPFDKAFRFLMRVEGGYVNDPRDPGGITKYGISKRAYPDLDIANLTEEDAKTIYQKDYWQACHCDDLSPELALAVFDCAVNQGVGIATRTLQQALKVKIDGIIGDETLTAANNSNETALLIDFLSWRGRRYAFTAGNETYLRGWLRRLFLLQEFIMKGE